jgi:hypothetical protein
MLSVAVKTREISLPRQPLASAAAASAPSAFSTSSPADTQESSAAAASHEALASLDAQQVMTQAALFLMLRRY